MTPAQLDALCAAEVGLAPVSDGPRPSAPMRDDGVDGFAQMMAMAGGGLR